MGYRAMRESYRIFPVWFLKSSEAKPKIPGYRGFAVVNAG
jgi:hypothetical protein